MRVIFAAGAIAVSVVVAIVAGLVVYLNWEPAYAIPSEVARRLDPKMQVTAHRLLVNLAIGR
jgi:hypothetical protein